MTRMIATLLDLGLIRRLPHPTDGRQAIISLSHRGENTINADRAAQESWLCAQLDQLSVADRTTLGDACHILAAILESESDVE